ncbi:hypothetical protein HRbin30_00199 [bacterium HR30]|nr:hypothetical protein HRbin30_00199 [bacterium HR30]
MNYVENIVAYATGLRFLLPHLSTEHFWPTLVTIHLIDAILCRIFARNNGYSANLWTILGLFTGIWAVVFLLLVTRRREAAVPSGSGSALGNDPSQGEVGGVGQGKPPASDP